MQLAVDLAGDDLRPRDLELVPLAAHRLDQDREVQLAAAGDGEDVRPGSVGSTRRERFVSSSRSSRSRSWREVEYCPSRPAKGEVLTPKVSCSVGSSMAIAGSASGALGSASVAPILDVGEAGQGDDVAGAGRVDLDAASARRRRSARSTRCRVSSPSGAELDQRVAGADACRAARGRWRSGPGAGRSRARRPASAPVPSGSTSGGRNLAHDRRRRAGAGRARASSGSIGPARPSRAMA